jgi:hypothetical protein
MVRQFLKFFRAHSEINVARNWQDRLGGDRKSLLMWVLSGVRGTVDQPACRHLAQNHHIF